MLFLKKGWYNCVHFITQKRFFVPCCKAIEYKPFTSMGDQIKAHEVKWRMFPEVTTYLVPRCYINRCSALFTNFKVSKRWREAGVKKFEQC